eukprot:s932_g16.t1
MSQSGVVKFYNSLNGYGFIRRGKPGGGDVYVHRSAIADGKMLLRGDKVCFDVIEEENRLCALRVTGGTGGYGLTFGCNVDRSTIKNLHGTVKKFFPEKGWGFILQEGGGSNLFFHSNAIESGDESLVVGSRVSYDSIFDATRGSRKAERVQCIAGEAADLPVAENRATEEQDLAAFAVDESDEEEWELAESGGFQRRRCANAAVRPACESRVSQGPSIRSEWQQMQRLSNLRRGPENHRAPGFSAVTGKPQDRLQGECCPNDEGVMLSCCKGALLKAEEAAAGSACTSFKACVAMNLREGACCPSPAGIRLSCCARVLVSEPAAHPGSAHGIQDEDLQIAP